MAVDWGAGVGPNEELTWERLLGLDGSLVFLEHVFWVISINTLFILIFAFCPYHIGHFATVTTRMRWNKKRAVWCPLLMVVAVVNGGGRC